MRRTSLAELPCSIARTMDLLGDWWTPLVLRDAYGGVTRFDQFQTSLGIARNTLAMRLSSLVDAELMTRVKYQDRPERFEYRLTAKGRDFFPVLAAISRWGDEWLSGAEGPPMLLHHDRCGQQIEAEVICSHCREPLQAEDVHVSAGPGFPDDARWFGARTVSDD